MTEQVHRTTPGLTQAGEPFDKHERRMIAEGRWRLEMIPADILGISRPLEVFRAERTNRFIEPWDQDDGLGSCPRHWADLKIGMGACGLRCRACFLMLTFRTMADPSRHVLYENTDKAIREVERWLRKPNRRTLGLGIDCSDSLLYEGVTGYARTFIPMFASRETNPHGARLLMLTKTANTTYLRGLPTSNVAVSFSVNPEPIADLWEGKFDDGVRVTPIMDRRLEACREAQELGFETRLRVDPILTPDGWDDLYREFFAGAVRRGLRPTIITLGTYREMGSGLQAFATGWGLPPLEIDRPTLVRDGKHLHLPRPERIQIYSRIRDLVREAWSGTSHVPEVALCKEPTEVRQAVGVNYEMCNCS